jgi:hypothetical protein
MHLQEKRNRLPYFEGERKKRPLIPCNYGKRSGLLRGRGQGSVVDKEIRIETPGWGEIGFSDAGRKGYRKFVPTEKRTWDIQGFCFDGSSLDTGGLDDALGGNRSQDSVRQVCKYGKKLTETNNHR